MITLTVIRNHLICDNRKFCVSCHHTPWPASIKKPRKYYRCEYCNLDILCNLGLTFNFRYTEALVTKIAKCSRCGEIVSEYIWPEPSKNSD